MQHYKITENDKDFLEYAKEHKNDSEFLKVVYEEILDRIVDMVDERETYREEIRIKQADGVPFDLSAMESAIAEMESDLEWIERLRKE
jgi:hypothetical protein